jgi:hypothetical protein
MGGVLSHLDSCDERNCVDDIEVKVLPYTPIDIPNHAMKALHAVSKL